MLSNNNDNNSTQLTTWLVDCRRDVPQVRGGARAKLEVVEALRRDMQAERDAAHAQCCALEAEVGRWRARSNQLIEQHSKLDSEAIKRIT